MQLPENFSFNQQNLEDFMNCRRLFYLRHVLKQEWPALESEPVREHEELMRLGEQFHRLVYQQGVGIAESEIETSFDDLVLNSWWQQYKTLHIMSVPGQKFFERLISVPFDNYRLLAKYDLIIFTPENKVLIYDWKTSQKEPQRKWVQKRLQTRIYPLVMALKKDPPIIQASEIEMTYWYPAFPKSAISFEYSPEQFAADQEYVISLISEIESLEPDQFGKTEQQRLCEFCRYRSLCERGQKAGDWRKQEDVEPTNSSAFDFDFNDLSSED